MVSPLGLYKCDRIPFRLSNTPATFQKLMPSCLGNLHLEWCINYLDDITFFAETPKEHLKWLQAVLEHLKEGRLKLKPNKCEFLKSSIVYIGCAVSEKGIKTDPKKNKIVKNWPVLKTMTKFFSFLGIMNLL